ncbi:MAG: anthranilate synthase component I family protein [Parachlamydiales bacterium]|nr:anthranilate synthase component I family protein [Parachlamydiales bacterium]
MDYTIKCPIEVLIGLAQKYADEEGTCLLYSGSSFDSASQTLLFLFPYQSMTISCHSKDTWDTIQESLGALNSSNNRPEWCGYITYEMGTSSQSHSHIPLIEPTIPLAYFQKCALTLRWKNGTLEIFGIEEHLEIDQKNEIDFLMKGQIYPVKDGLSSTVNSIVKPLESINCYKKKVLAIQEEILCGNVYQVNLSQQCVLKGTFDPFYTFLQIIKTNPAPFCVYFKTPNATIVSSSPERLLKKTGSILETRPIKGTAPRGKNSAEDENQLSRLKNSIKDKAELLMITDLMRNDLSQVSIAGTVNTKELWRIETYTNVFHMLSIIQSTARSHYHPLEIIKKIFPGGSITGCPKLKAIEFIHQLEQRSRGVYTGSIGYFCANGDFDFNIAIRTLVFQDDLVDIQIGGAIVCDSNPELEYQETLHKGQTLFKVLNHDLCVL